MTDLGEVAAGQGGVFTAVQARASGLRPGQVRTRVRSGAWFVLARGVYAERRTVEAADSPAARHVLDTAALLLTSRLGVVASHRTAALVHGLPVLAAPPSRPQRTRTPRFAGDSSATPGLYVATLSPAAVTAREGVPVTAPARTACDVARHDGVRSGLVVADAALRAGLDPGDLVATARGCSDWPGGRWAVGVARTADGRADTPLETITRWGYDEQGLPPPETQVEIRAPDGRLLGLVDFLWRQHRTIGEADGLLKYDQDGALRREKLREQELRLWGFEVVRSTWNEVWTAPGRHGVARRVRQAFLLAADRPGPRGVRYRIPPLSELRRRDRGRRAA